LAAPTRSSNERAGFAVALGLAACVAIPVAVAIARESPRVGLLDAGWAVPVAFVFAVAALVVGRRARRDAERRVTDTGRGLARVGTALGTLGLCLALSGAIAVGFYFLLKHLE